MESGKLELASIILDIQRNEEELLVVRFFQNFIHLYKTSFSAAYQVARLQKNEDEEELRNCIRVLRNKISELLEDYKAELD